MFVAACFHLAVEAIYACALMGIALKLHGRVTNLVPLTEHGGE